MNELLQINRSVVKRKNEVIDSFLASKLSSKTKAAYKNDLKQFLVFSGCKNIEELLNLENPIITDLLISFRNSICKFDNDHITNASTVTRKMTAIKSFFKFLCSASYIDKNPAEVVKNLSVPNESSSESLTISELKLIYEKVSENKNKILALRDRIIISLLFQCAMRRESVSNLKIKNIKLESSYYTIQFLGKRNKKYMIPLRPELFNDILEYLNLTDRSLQDSEEFLFLNCSNNKTQNSMNRISDKSIYNLVKKYSIKAGINKRISPHSFRHTAVTLALDEGATYREVMNLTGHSDTRLVMRYDRGDKLKNNAVWKLPVI